MGLPVSINDKNHRNVDPGFEGHAEPVKRGSKATLGRWVTLRFKRWRFILISLASVILGFPIAFGNSSPTADYVHWRGAIVSPIVTCVGVTCFCLSKLESEFGAKE